jgi:hypothetical protein
MVSVFSVKRGRAAKRGREGYRKRAYTSAPIPKIFLIGGSFRSLIVTHAIESCYYNQVESGLHKRRNTSEKRRKSPRSASRVYGQRYPGRGGRPDKIVDLIWRKTLSLDADGFPEPFPALRGKGSPEFLKIFAGNQNPLLQKKGSDLREEKIEKLEIDEPFLHPVRQALFPFIHLTSQPCKGTSPAEHRPCKSRQSSGEGQPRTVPNQSSIKVIHGFSIQKDGLHPVADVFRAQSKMIREEGLDTHPDPGLHPEALLQDWKKGRDLVRGEIEFEDKRRMCLFFEGMGNIVFHSPLDTCARIFWGG